MVQSGLESHIDDPESGSLLQSVHKILQPEMSVKHSFFSFFRMCTYGPGVIALCVIVCLC